MADDVSSLADITEEGTDKDTLEQNLKQIECQVAIGKFLEVLNFDKFLGNYKVALNETSQVCLLTVHIIAATLLEQHNVIACVLQYVFVRVYDKVFLVHCYSIIRTQLF